MRVLDARQMRAADQRTIEEIGIGSIVLMENAGRQVVAAIEAAFDTLETMHVSVLAGRGSNGGDGFVVARALAERGIAVRVYLLGESASVRGDARTNLDILRKIGIDIVEIAGADDWEAHGTDALGADLLVDALFGTGLRGPLDGLAATIVTDVNATDCPVVAVDLPSGLSADRTDVPGPAVQATMTVTFTAPKLPLIFPPAEDLAGALVVADIGIPEQVVDALDGPRVEVVTRDRLRAAMEPRSLDSHKGDYGRVLIVAGSPGRTGAAGLAAMAALRSGAGLVTVATPAAMQPLVAGIAPEFMTLALPAGADGIVTEAALEAVLGANADVIAVGPGLGCSASATAFVHGLLERASTALVLDADALTSLAGQTDRLAARDDLPIVITPHPGEMARLVGLPIEDVQGRRIEVARQFAATHRVHVVLKGYRTLVASPDGVVAVNLTGNPGMATGGTGDVLLGVLAGWLGQLHDPDAAARLAVYLHGLAGDLAVAEVGEVALVAGDLVDHLGDAVLELQGRRATRSSDP